MFGLANRTPLVRIETRARNAVTTLWPDADQAHDTQGIDRRRRRRHDIRPAHRKTAARRLGTGIDARASRDAGSYLCNYLSWRAIEATGHDSRSAPRRVRPCAAAGARRRLTAPRAQAHRITLEQLVDAGEAMLLEMVKLTRRAVRELASSI